MDLKFDYFEFIVVCDLKNDKPKPRYNLPKTKEEFKNDTRTLRETGNRYFWSETKEIFVIQVSISFEPAPLPSKIKQLFFSGSDFKNLTIKEEDQVLFLPNREFVEVYPEMHPGRMRK